jgi:hypothetical protein
MACVDAGVMRLEGDFAKAIEQATRYKISGNTLSVYAGIKRIMKFQRGTENGSSSSSDIKLADKKMGPGIDRGQCGRSGWDASIHLF